MVAWIIILLHLLLASLVTMNIMKSKVPHKWLPITIVYLVPFFGTAIYYIAFNMSRRRSYRE